LAVLGTAACLALALVAVAFSQDMPGQSSDDIEVFSDVQWLWGEAVSVDTEKGEILVRYMDYDNEEEREITVTVDEETAYENVESFAKIKPQDTLSIDYIIAPDAKCLAKLISFEKAESLEDSGGQGHSVEDLPEYLDISDTAQD
jgi:hypothetical protein